MSEDQGDCRVWVRSRLASGGYGQINVDGQPRRAHVVAWETENGPVPEGMVVRHKCDNPPCIKIEHLEIGTYKDNTQDMAKRGRGWWQVAS